MSDPFRTNDPTQFDDIDGIIIDETAPPPSVQGVPSNIVCLVGQFQRGTDKLQQVGSIGDFQAKFGKSAFSGNQEIKNKRFGSLRIIRVIASDAVKADFTFNDGAGGPTAEVFTILAIADVSGSLSGKFLNFETISSTGVKTKRYLWMDNGSSVDPAPSGRTGHTVVYSNDDTANTISGLIQVVLDALTDLASVDTPPTTTNTMANPGDVDDAVDVDTGFTVTASIQGDGSDLLKITALDKGAYGNNITVKIEDASSGPGKKYTVTDTNTDAVIEAEVLDGVAIVGKTQAQIDSIFAGSRLIRADLVGTPVAEPVNNTENLASGSDGTVTDTDYEDAMNLELASPGSCNAVWLDEYNVARRSSLLIAVSAQQDKMGILAGDDENQTVSQVITDVALNRDTDGRMIYTYPYANTRINAVLTPTNPGSWMASIISQTSPHIDPAFAGNAGFLVGIASLTKTLTRSDYISLKDAGVSTLENDPDLGIKYRMGITTQILNSSKVTILRRRMADFLTNSLGRFLKNFQNAPNTRSNRNDVTGQMLAFDEGLIRDGILPSDDEVQNGKARVIDSESLNTNTGIGLGFFKILYKRRIFSAMRFIVLQAEIGETVVVTEAD